MTNIVLQTVKYCANTKANLLSKTALLSQGSTLKRYSENNIVVSTYNEKVIMDIKIKTQDDWVSVVDIFMDTNLCYST